MLKVNLLWSLIKPTPKYILSDQMADMHSYYRRMRKQVHGKDHNLGGVIMASLFGNLVNGIFGLLGIIIVIGIIARLCSNYFSKEKEVRATVVNKQSYDKQIYSKSQASYTKKEYVITFQCGNKKRHFDVSELSYGNYRINQKGILRYKGSRLIDFK